MSSDVTQGFTKEQQHYLQGFALGADVARIVQGLPVLSNLGSPATSTTVRVGGSEDLHQAAQDRFLAAGKKLTAEETAKREENPFDMWDEMRENAAAGIFPK